MSDHFDRALLNGAAGPPWPRARFAHAAGRVLLTALARLRFVAILAVIGVVITQWDTLTAYYQKWARPAGDPSAADPDTEYYCPMHPTVVRDNNKEKCPICFMPLAKRKKGAATDEPLPPGVVSRKQYTPYQVVLAGVRTAEVGYRPLTKWVTTVGTVEFDERGLKQVAARVKGRIDTLLVNQTGQWVKLGQPLAELYSPDLVVTVQNLLDARRSGNAELLRLARERLELWGIEPDQVRALLESGQPVTRLTVRSPIDGHVVKKYPREGQYVEEGSPLYDVADLSTVWVQAQLYEDDLAFLPPAPRGVPQGEPLRAAVTTRAFPAEEFAGTLSFIYPHVDPDSRTLTARIELPNPGHRLRPGMTATVRLDLSPEQAGPAAARMKRRGGQVLAVPEAAVIDTGSQQVVYREETPGVFEGVKVELGPRMAGPDGAPFFPVLGGVSEGERVVAAGSFLLDAETRLNPAAGSIFVGASSGKGGPAPAAPVRPSTPEDPDLKVAAAMARLSPEDRAAAETQGFCPVLEGSRLGVMGPPVKLDLGGGKAVFVCCKNCVAGAKADPARTLARADELRGRAKPLPAAPAPPPAPAAPPPGPASPEEEAEIRENLAKLPPAERAEAERQRYCPETGARLGSMPKPSRVTVNGRVVFTCCAGCDAGALAKPDETLKKVAEFKAQGKPAK
jgi:RND family efflux transporter MFP subunit